MSYSLHPVNNILNYVMIWQPYLPQHQQNSFLINILKNTKSHIFKRSWFKRCMKITEKHVYIFVFFKHAPMFYLSIQCSNKISYSYAYVLFSEQKHCNHLIHFHLYYNNNSEQINKIYCFNVVSYIINTHKYITIK